MTLNAPPHGGHGGHPHGGHPHGGGGYARYGYGPGRGWGPGPYAYAPEVLIVAPTTGTCQYAIALPSGAQHVITGVCPPGGVPLKSAVVITAL